MIIKLNFENDIPLYIQLRNQIVVGIGKGDLSFGEKLPTVRQMAEDLGINVMTVNKTYAILKNEGYISIDRRHGAKVSPILNGNKEFKEKLEDELTLAISEASLQGMKKEEFLKICKDIYCSIGLEPSPSTD